MPTRNTNGGTVDDEGQCQDEGHDNDGQVVSVQLVFAYFVCWCNWYLYTFVYLCIFAGANLKLNEERRMPEEITDEKPINLRLESILSSLASAS